MFSIFCLDKNCRKWLTEDGCKAKDCEYNHKCLEKKKHDMLAKNKVWLHRRKVDEDCKL